MIPPTLVQAFKPPLRTIAQMLGWCFLMGWFTTLHAQSFSPSDTPAVSTAGSLAAEVAALKLEIIKLKNQPKSTAIDRSDRERMDRMQQEVLQTRAELQRVRRDMDELNNELKRFKNMFFKHF